MKDIVDFFEEKKTEYLQRAKRCEEQIPMWERSYKHNESAYGSIAGWPTAVIPDEHGRKQYMQAIAKKERFLAKIELIEEIQETYGFGR